jgi:hypothetical protein
MVPDTHPRYQSLVAEKEEFLRHWKQCVDHITTWN